MDISNNVSDVICTNSALMIENKDIDTDRMITNQEEPTNYSRIHSLYAVISNIGFTLYEKLFPKSYDILEKAEEQIYRCVKTPLYHYYVDITEETKMWTVSSVPKQIMDKYKHRILNENDIKYYNLDRIPVLMIHGFCAGSGFWSMNIDAICDTDIPIFCIDIPGFGHSSRISFPNDSQKTEDIFLDCFEEWREQMGLNKLILIGHSMGGFLSMAYTLKYPQIIERVILVDTWGFPDLKETVTEVMKKESTSVVGYYLVNKQGWIRVISFLVRPFSPFALLRTLGSIFGPKLIHKARPQFAQRYAKVYGDDDFSTISNYIYSINSFTPTGEDAFRSLAHPLGWAKNPMLPRIHNLPSSVSITFIYGSRSWITSESGFETKEILKSNHVKVYVIDNAGHHVYADQPNVFNHIIQKTIRLHNLSTKNSNLPQKNSSYIKAIEYNGYKTNIDEVRADNCFQNTDKDVIW